MKNVFSVPEEALELLECIEIEVFLKLAFPNCLSAAEAVSVTLLDLLVWKITTAAEASGFATCTIFFTTHLVIFTQNNSSSD